MTKSKPRFRNFGIRHFPLTRGRAKAPMLRGGGVGLPMEPYMFLSKLNSADGWFEVLATTSRSQTAVMNLEPGQASAENPESHPGSDQVLVVLEGEVHAQVAEERARMMVGHAVVIPAGVPHRFENNGAARARTLSVYAPPAYPARSRQ
jgi:mannose-6-phosphate isomerase-like protein (cupin superfamily)